MIDLRQLTPDLAVSPQIEPEDVAALAAAGFRMLINNRPDAEISAPLGDQAMRAAAEAAGIGYVYLPFNHTELTQTLIEDFAEAATAGKPALAYCRSGNRCTVLWGLTQAGKRPLPEIIEIAAHAGYDLSPVAPMIQSLASRKG